MALMLARDSQGRTKDCGVNVASIYGKAVDLIDTLDDALKKSDPMLTLGPELMRTGLSLMSAALVVAQRSVGTLDRCDRALDRVFEQLSTHDVLLAQLQQRLSLENRKLQLEIERLES